MRDVRFNYYKRRRPQAVFISRLGLFGLAAFIAARRSREVAVRKVLGASIWSVVRTLGREFVLLVLAANVIAWPLGWYAMSRWIRNFVHHTRIGLEVFVVSGPAALGIALVAISLQIYRAAAANPADRLRNE